MAFEELEKVIQKAQITSKHAGSLELNYSEFLVATIETKMEITDEHLWSIFKHFGTDDSGQIS
jgi:Ca2+-binding EF-hand superfamily protein